MSHRQKSFLFRKVATPASLLFLFLCGSIFIHAQDPDSLAREINSDLRKAQNLMFSGKLQEAAAYAAEIQGKLDQLKGAASQPSAALPLSRTNLTN